ncbi:hypothetical protein ACA910_009033 [Epithemia clementina (nom. ined.)]
MAWRLVGRRAAGGGSMLWHVRSLPSSGGAGGAVVAIMMNDILLLPEPQPHSVVVRRRDGSVKYFSSSSSGNNNQGGPPLPPPTSPSSGAGGGGPGAGGGNAPPSSFSSSFSSIPIRKSSFQPRRRPPKEYRPFVAKKKTPYKEEYPGNPILTFDTDFNMAHGKNDLERIYGPYYADVVVEARRERAILDSDHMNVHDPIEEQMRAADFMTTEPGSTEEQIYRRRLMEHLTLKEQTDLHEDLDEIMATAEERWLNLEDDSDFRYLKPSKDDKEKKDAERKKQEDEEEILYSRNDDDPDSRFDPNASAYGVWGEYIVTVSRGNHNWRGGRLYSYRAMVVGGNGNGCAGFGVGQGKTALAAVDKAGRQSRRNVFFVNRYQGERLTRDLVGKHNSCKVILREVNEGLRGNVLCREILARFGITNASCKAFGRRHPWSVVYATFKAILSHESIEDIALKTGQRLVTVDKAARVRL